MRCIRLIQLEPYQNTARVDIPFEVSFIKILNSHITNYGTEQLHGLISIRSNLFNGEIPLNSFSDSISNTVMNRVIDVYKGDPVPINGSYDFQLFDTNANWTVYTNLGAWLIVEFRK